MASILGMAYVTPRSSRLEVDTEYLCFKLRHSKPAVSLHQTPTHGAMVIAVRPRHVSVLLSPKSHDTMIDLHNRAGGGTDLLDGIAITISRNVRRWCVEQQPLGQK